MYKILIKYDNDKFNLWMPYGTTTTSTTGKSEFTEFETDDVTVSNSANSDLPVVEVVVDPYGIQRLNLSLSYLIRILYIVVLLS